MAIKVVLGQNADSVMATVIAEELKNMSRAMNQSEMHPHLVGFHGACFQKPGIIQIISLQSKNSQIFEINIDALISPMGSVNVIMELCENGSLHAYLNKMKDGEIAIAGYLTDQCCSQLMSWAEQVAKGMEYLAKQNVCNFIIQSGFWGTFFGKCKLFADNSRGLGCPKCFAGW